MPGKAIRARGVVQGVGFRPAVWRLARQHGLTGTVWNDGEGVMIHLFGSAADLAEFIRRLPIQLPPLARLDSLEVTDLPDVPHDAFRIVASRADRSAQTPVAADAATCPACLKEIADPANRRYRYPFTNCTHCGPRLSIVRRVPFDRCNTSMAAFPLCPLCRQEFEDPSDRRFHAQSNCCPDCGPKLWLEDSAQQVVVCADPLVRAAELLEKGWIVAIKGLGGLHLACNAADAGAVARLRQRKRRYAKPFALMARDLAMIALYADVSELEKQALLGQPAPIVLLQAHGQGLAPSVAPDGDKLGFLLPYTPLHVLLMQELEAPIVLTSGNVCDEPQCIDNGEARDRLAGIADYWLLHDRDIVNRLDDSVVREMSGTIRMLRRGRGYSPEAMLLPQGFKTTDGVLAMGAELKNSFCLVQQGRAVVGQHIGDLENAAVQRDYREMLALYQQLFEFTPQRIAVDNHPRYLSTQYGQELAAKHQVKLLSVQHHHAHLAACLVEHGVALDAPPVLAAIFDGLGMGDDGTLWGGEFLLAGYRGYTRLARFQPLPMPGGNQAIREPWRNAYAQLAHYFDWLWLQQQFADVEIIRLLQSKPLNVVTAMLAKNLNAPLASSCGRWFDAFAAALGLHAEQTQYEGQAAIALETLAALRFAEESPYPQAYSLTVGEGLTTLRWQGLWLRVLTDLQDGADKARIAARIHHSLIDASVALLLELSSKSAIDSIVLSGGVFQNKLLLEGIVRELHRHGKKVLTPRLYPANDGGLALGQAAIAAAIRQ